MKPFTIGVWASVIVSLLFVAGAVLSPLARNAPAAGKLEAALAPSLTTEIYDMFNVPWGDWWDYRTAVYGDIPLGADCFSFDSIPGGAASPNPAGTGVCDVPPTGYSGETWDTYPYIDVYPWYGNRQSIAMYAPYRMRMTGVDQPGSTLAQPVILPVFNSAAAAGTTLSVNWDMQYLNTTRVNQLNGVCASIYQDGFLIESFITATMDLQESKRLFGVVATTDAEAQSWWNANVDPDCFLKGTIETNWQNFMIQQGGVAGTMGTYDVYNSFEWYYQPFMSAFSAVVDPVTHLTTVKIDHVAWGTEVLLARWFHWGPNSYLTYAETYPQNYAGWWKWYLAWFEDLHFSTNIGSAAQSFTLSTAMNYQLQAYANPGPDGVYHTGTVSSTDDFAEWLWQPFLTDYAYGGTASVKHTVSELDPYATYTYNHGTPCSVFYGTYFQYEFVPAEWDLGLGDMVTIRAPLNPVDFVNVYSPLTSDASTCATFSAMMGFSKSTPALPATSSATDSNGDTILDTVTLVGPIDWGAPAQPLWGFPALEFTAQVPPPPELRKADLIGRSAWPESHHFVLSKDADGVQSLYAKVANLGNIEVSAAVIFEIRDSTGALVATIHTATVKIGIGLSAVIVDGWTSPVLGKYSVTAVVHYDANGDGTLDTFGLKVKSFSFTVVP